MPTVKKPIAVLTHKVSHAIDYMEVDLKIPFREKMVAKRRLVRNDGQEYILIYEPEQLLGLEISEMLIIPGASRNPRYSEMYDLGRTRLR